MKSILSALCGQTAMSSVGQGIDDSRAPPASESQQSLSQKEAITAQMIGIISSRLNALQVLANGRKFGLESDLEVNVDYCSKMVPSLQDPYESRSSANSRAKTVSSTQLASNQAMLERLFGPDDKTRLRTQVLKKNKADQQKNENRRNTRVQLEKQLQASIEGHITRSVDNYMYGSTTDAADTGHSLLQSTLAITVNPKLLLQHTCERMRITHGKKNFKRFLLSELSCALFEDTFWLVFCHFFQRNSMSQQRALVDTVSTRYIKILSTLRTTKSDYVFRVYPYAVASGVCWGFHYLFPGSRHLYSIEFKNDVFLFVGQLMLGLRLCPVSVQSMRRQFFPDEVLEEPATAKTKGASVPSDQPNATANVIPDLSSLLPQLKSSQSSATLDSGPTQSSLGHLSKCSSESHLVKQSIAENSVNKILNLPRTSSSASLRDGEDVADGILQAPRQFRTHQLRTFFNASQLSPLMKEYLGADQKNLKKPSYLRRTTPFADCPVGGEDTFHKHYHRSNQRSYASDAQRKQEKCIKDIQRVQHDTRRELAVLSETRDIVLNSGKKALQAYCTLLLSKKNSEEEGEASATTSGHS